MKKKNRVLIVLLIGLSTWVMPAGAASLIGLDRATFQDAVAGGTVTGQDFDALTPGTVLTTLDGVTYSASGGNVIVTNSFLTSTSPNGIGSTSLGFFSPNEIVTFVFDEPITAFAIDVNTFATADGAYFAFLESGDFVSSVFDVFPGFTTGQFVGFLSDTPFSSVTIVGVAGFSYTLDTLVYGDGAAIFLQTLQSAVSGLGPGKSLSDKITLAQAYNLAKDYPATCSMLKAFQNQVRALRGKKIAPDLADELIGEASFIRDLIGCN